jgi:IS5 family transposase
MRRVYVLPQWFDLSDPATEAMLYASEPMRRFARVELGDDRGRDDHRGPEFHHDRDADA